MGARAATLLRMKQKDRGREHASAQDLEVGQARQQALDAHLGSGNATVTSSSSRVSFDDTTVPSPKSRVPDPVTVAISSLPGDDWSADRRADGRGVIRAHGRSSAVVRLAFRGEVARRPECLTRPRRAGWRVQATAGRQASGPHRPAAARPPNARAPRIRPRQVESRNAAALIVGQLRVVVVLGHESRTVHQLFGISSRNRDGTREAAPSPGGALRRMGQVQPVPGPCQADVRQPPLLLHLTRVVQRPRCGGRRPPPDPR